MHSKGYQRRLAAIFLGLFLGLLAMVTLHDFSHRADDVQAVPVSTSQELTTHADQTDCVLCQFVHTPFLALTLGVILVEGEFLGIELLRLTSRFHTQHTCMNTLS